MQVCNISFQIEPSIQDMWIHWMQKQFIPTLMQSNCFTKYHLYALEVDAEQAPTYTLQLFAKDADNMLIFRNQHEMQVLSILQNTWQEQCFHFSTYMSAVY